ncbi:type I-G CRISPR-associated protein Csb2 [Tuwongella immobilis]|uniref:Type I-U CRISPR-associated protein Cas5/Cas6 n=1 Tax=Tuwongella immobilis TaxID=692036 RepID=A0A6C2YKR5_9BACT|nr:type I-U CRISPR-associated protein Csb2 [Tuwongella immobilis]VIP01703.1 CRISPR-associated protein, GSU0054 family OS=Planctomyces limnophilus (strain ATCC 43296 / DSM 3776 / IFAM 1008 / 290) GN=Plim_3150 PE=4 SV=1: Cas_GSU0054 [Tuwongella immobilis]VTR99197.1 CRISPR-associated protein, GSU0054 family OS=Planctomyces limnophilus (strain ATCC 43296 / DSM 3776 / IFAM 1008 / 290) GN=Plim_3150 PE=4 SV=1: Cas_GSU0054 [Tuwongella immobilis]
MTRLCLTVRFLQPTQHGRGDGDNPEWPPSPLRLFQALVAASAGRWNERVTLMHAAPAMRWLESLPPPEIVAPNGVPSESPRQVFVPDNTAELAVPAWRRGEVDQGTKRTEKVVCPTHLVPIDSSMANDAIADGGTVHYLFESDEHSAAHLPILRSGMRSLTHLGWGVDQVVGDAAMISDAEANALSGHRWNVTANGGVILRVPQPGTLDAIIAKHAAFLGRLEQDTFRPVPPLSVFRMMRYHSHTAGESVVPRHCFAAFQLLNPAGERFLAVNPVREARNVAAWVRHITGEICRDWPDVATFVHGHAPDGGQAKGAIADQRFQYLPIPTINAALKRVEAIRRVIVAAPIEFQDRIDFIRRRLVGQTLVGEGRPVGMLNLIPRPDPVLRQYVGKSCTWSTVIPVIWPGHDDRSVAKGRKLLRKAFRDAGVHPQVIDDIQELDWRPSGFRPGVAMAHAYERPQQLTGSIYHVRVRFKQPIVGPLAIGSGRYRGFGLFAHE